MKKFILLSTLTGLTITTIQAQLNEKLQKPQEAPRKTISAKTTPSPVPASTTNTMYYLSSINVTLFTGNDNKEALSKISFYLFRTGGASTDFGNTNPDVVLSGSAYFDPGEMKINSNRNFALELAYTPRETQYMSTMSLSNIQKYGIKLQISYLPNFILDAWKIDKIDMTLEFKDAQGNPHPTLGRKTISFINVSTLLTNNKNSLACEADGFLMPKN